MMQYLTIKDASELAHVSRRTIGRWMTAKHIRFVANERCIRIDAASLREFLARRANPRSKCSISVNVNISIDMDSLRSAFNKLKEALQS